MADFFDALGAALGKKLATEAKAHKGKLTQLWDTARAYVPPDVRAQMDRAGALVTLGFVPGDEPTDAEIGDAFRQVARECHPDRNPGDAEAEARYKAASNARDVLVAPQPQPAP